MNKRFDYTKIGLEKAEGIVTFDKKGTANLPKESVTWLANYGLFVNLTRELAGHEKESDSDKKGRIAEQFAWLESGMPKREKAKVDVIGTITKKAEASDNLTDKEKKELARLLGKMK